MKTKLVWIISILVVISLIISGIAIANINKEVKIFEPSESLIGKDNTKNIIVYRDGSRDTGRDDIKGTIASKIIAKNVYKRVISDYIDEEGIKLFETEGCLIKHRLKHSASFDCPIDVIPKLNVREARIFHILDLEADQQIKADQVWAEGINGSGVNVVILDSGIDSSHIELSDSILGCENFVTGETCEDLNGHGTHVAGIITANGVYEISNAEHPIPNKATGVAPGAGIYMLKVCDKDGNCYEDDMMAAMEYAINLDAKIMSISIGGGNFGSHCDSDPLAAKVNWVVDNGFTAAVASGNDGKGVSSPACASKAIAIGAVDKSNVVPYWSNRGAALDVIAPGVDTLSAYSCLAAGDCSSYWYAWMDGTSMATPHIAGVISLLLQTNTTLTTNEIKQALYSTATPAAKCYECTRWAGAGKCVTQTEVTCTSNITGAGIVNAYEAYLAVKPAGKFAHLGEISGGGFPNYLYGAWSVFVSGDVAYVVSLIDDALTTFNVSNPSNITHMGNIFGACAARSPNCLDAPTSVYVSGYVAYVVSYYDNTLTSFNVTDPSNIIPIGNISGAGAPNYLYGAQSVYVSGNVAYVASFEDDTLTAFNVSNPPNITHMGNISGAGAPNYLNGAESVFVSGNIAYVASRLDDALTTFNVSNPSNIIHIGSISGSGSPNYLNGPVSVFVSGDVAYVASTHDDALTLFNVSNPSNIIHIGSISGSGSPNYLDYPYSVHVSGNVAYVVSYSDNSLTAFDVSDPSNISFIDAISGRGHPNYLYGPYSVFVSGDVAYVASYGDNALTTFKIPS